MPDAPEEYPNSLLGPDEWLKEAKNAEKAEVLPSTFQGFLPPMVKGRATLLGGPPGGGKTALGLQEFRSVIEGGKKAAYITLEMTPYDLFERFERQFDSNSEAEAWVKDNKPYVSESSITPNEIERIVRNGFDFIVIDHAHELPYSDRRDLEVQVAHLMALAPNEGVCILMLAQLRRPDPQFPRPPSKHDFKESGVFEQKASVVLALYQEDEHSVYSEIYTLKNRFGGRYDPLSVRLNERKVIFERV